LAAWVFALCLQMFLMLIFPTFIQPLFNKFDPLPAGSLHTKIEELARRLKFPLSKIFVMDGSKRSSHSNAYFFGFFTKRIVIFDTLIAQSSEDEICAVLAHELGHWKCWHTMQNFILAQVQMFSMFYGYSLFSKQATIFEAFGFPGQSVPLVVGFMLVR
jgi:STE24 endopeptidase